MIKYIWNKVLGIIFVLQLSLGGYGYDHKDPIKSEADIEKAIVTVPGYIREQMAKYDIEKVSIAVVSKDQIIYQAGFGADEDEQFQAASITKVLTAYGALKLVEKGELDLDLPLSSYTKTSYFQLGSMGNRISLRMVLSHTAGMSNDTSGKDRKVYVEPGREFHYSGGAYEYLRYVMETITGIPLDQYMEQEVLKPLRMDHSRFSLIDKKGIKHIYASGGLVTTAHDLALFFIELMQPTHLAKDLVHEMLSDAVRIDRHNAWGLGIALQHGNGQDEIWHNGNNGNVWESLAFFSPRNGAGVIVMTKGKYGYRAYANMIHYVIGGSYYGLLRIFNNSTLP